MIKNTISPTFGAEFEFKIEPDFPERNMRLHFRVFDHDRLSGSDQLGECDVDLRQSFGEDWNRWIVQKLSNTVELTDYQGKVKKKFVKRKISDLVDATIDDTTNSQCDLKQVLLKKTIYGRLTFELRFQPGTGR
jgi:Ca2+-dependent lipid-binding protein